MPRTITKTYTLYTFNELSDKAKDKARDWYRNIDLNDMLLWEFIRDDAEAIGLEIISLDKHRANMGKFMQTALSTALSIIRNHGKGSETHKTAEEFLSVHDKFFGVNGKITLADNCEDDDANRYELDNEYEEAKGEFMSSLLGDYYSMYEKEIERLNEDEQVDESILVNEYTFDEDGKRKD